ncbi:hypothetical protein IF1G_05987 [Cordyceps javanica]|uniref:Uncharacterized protein n=1 Tax=Cordyceps javanica TaxID=43265 RepID=A0A545VVP5_9HYPO|nr:hypothetical protein IF1G_05987 [Cordyceps javanica]TQW05791.1 hypothetical protein IF2G_06913 [Cordyceps javanica]
MSSGSCLMSLSVVAPTHPHMQQKTADGLPETEQLLISSLPMMIFIFSTGQDTHLAQWLSPPLLHSLSPYSLCAAHRLHSLYTCISVQLPILAPP